jgi:hypothetical protein
MTTTTLTIAERASVALVTVEYEANLTELVKSSARIAEIKNGDGYKEAHGARMNLKNTRVAIQKAGKDAREDAQAFSKAVIAEANRLTAMIEPEETRLQSLQEEWDAAREAERQEKIRAEQTRIEGHRYGIDMIRNLATKGAAASVDALNVLIECAMSVDASADTYEEFAPAADKAKSETLAALQELHAAAVAREAEALRLQAEREELARLRAEQEAREAAERTRIAAEQKAEAERLAAERRQFEEEHRALRAAQAEADRKAAEARAAEQARLDAERAEIRRQQDAIAAEQRRKQDEEASAARAEADRKAAAVRKAEDARIAAERAEADRLQKLADDKQRQIEAARRKTNALRSEIDAELDALNDEQLVDILHFIRILSAKAE